MGQWFRIAIRPFHVQEPGLVRYSLTLLLVAAGVVLSACGGSSQSSQDKARSNVCDARADIQKQVGQLSALTLSTATVDGFTANLTAIRGDLAKITDAQRDLSGDRKKQVQAANQAFAQQVRSTVQSVGKTLSLAQAESQIRAALGQLANSYRQTLGKIDCG
jgi:hypothetical protein